MKVFLDTSVLVSALLSKTGASAKLLALGEAGLLELVISDQVVEEFFGVLQRKFKEAEELASQLLAKTCKIIVLTPEGTDSAKVWIGDPKDVHILLGAKQAQADVLVTLDVKDFIKDKAVAEKSGLHIMTPAELLTHLRALLS